LGVRTVGHGCASGCDSKMNGPLVTVVAACTDA
jgi:hypothetical protein